MKKSLSEKIFTTIHQNIATGVYSPGQKLPSEREFESEFKVSRITVNRALTKLNALGLLDRRQGMGTFVTEREVPAGDKTPSVKRTLVKYISPGGEKKGDVYVRMGILEGAHDILEKQNVDVTITFFYSQEDYLNLLAKYDRPNLFGLILWQYPCPQTDKLLLEMKEKNYPFVLVDQYNPKVECDYVMTDNIDGAGRMIDFLVSKGHRRIVYMTDERGFTSLQDRQAGAIKGMLTHKLPINNSSVLSVDMHNQDAVRQVVRSVVRQPDAPTAIFAGNDHLAFKVYDALKEIGLRVPDDISLAGYDNVDQGKFFEIPLTTISQDFYRMGQLAGVLLEEQNVQKVRQYYRQLTVKPSLVERKSVRAI